MRDYIFNSRIQARQRAQRRKIRLISLLVIVLVAIFGINYFTGTDEPVTADTFSDTLDISKSNDQNDTLILPAQNRSKPKFTGFNQEIETPDNSINNPDQANTVSQGSTFEESPLIVRKVEKTAVETPGTTEIAGSSSDTETVNRLNWIEHQIKQGESLSTIFKEHDLPPAVLHRIINSSKTAAGLAKIRPGQTVHFGMNQDQRLEQLTLERNRVSSLHISLSDTDIIAEEKTRDLEKETKATSGIIRSSLFVDAQAAGLSDKLIMQMIEFFGWEIDFALEVMPGDSFTLIHEEQYLDGEKYSDGPILSAEFINQGIAFRAVRYTDPEGNANYYDDTGHAKKRAFIRTPVDFTRISSGFTRKRWHPVLKKWRSHKGVDYAAPRGTRVKAAGNGRIVFKGKKGGYGNAIFLRHGGKYTTVYGHLSRFARRLKVGSKVKQGQVIAFVGSSGLATGPHLHYEFRVNGIHRNPLTVKLPKSTPLPKKQMREFERQTAPLLAELDRQKSKSMVALVKRDISQQSRPLMK